MLVYDAPNRETGETEITFMYDNLITLGGTSNKRSAFGFIKLHEAFFANIKNVYIHSYGTSSKLTEYYNNKIPPQSAITLDQKLKQAGSMGNKTLKMYVKDYKTTTGSTGEELYELEINQAFFPRKDLNN
jgi:hypothetical protein